MPFVSVPLEDLEAFLTARGFTPDVSGGERTFVRVGTVNPTLKIVVYTSVAVGASAARGTGKDAIRVVLLGTTPGVRDGVRCLGKTTRVNRTGTVAGVLQRLKARIIEASTLATTYGPPCPRCGGTTYGDSGRCVGACYSRPHPRS